MLLVRNARQAHRHVNKLVVSVWWLSCEVSKLMMSVWWLGCEVNKLMMSVWLGCEVNKLMMSVWWGCAVIAQRKSLMKHDGKYDRNFLRNVVWPDFE